jgi:DNA-binding GntR family transcriptional regulator
MPTRAMRKDAAEAVYHALKRDITHFEFKPGERLVETMLSERYGVSRTPIREALRRLTEEGIVRSTGKGGRIVPQFDSVEYEDLYAIRVVLEELAVVQACARATPEEIRALRESWNAGFEAPALDGSYVEANERFHLGIAQLSHNEMLSAILRRIHERTRVITMVDFTSRERIETTEREHDAILDAIERQDVATAPALVHSHIFSSRESIEELARRALGRIYMGA